MDAEKLSDNLEDQAKEPQVGSSDMIERAKNVLGRDFLGEDAIRIVEQRLAEIGVNVEFDISELPDFPYTEQDLQLACSNGEMLVLRPAKMLWRGAEVALTLQKLQELFTSNPLRHGGIFYHYGDGDWYRVGKESFYTSDVIKPQWALVKKEVLDGSLGKTWEKQEAVLGNYRRVLETAGAGSVNTRRRTAVEIAWDTVLYYTNTSERLLGKVFDWGQTRSSGNSPVCVGCFGLPGMRVGSPVPSTSTDYLGLCPSR